MIVCNQCGRDNDDQHNFCLGCGANLKLQAKSEAAPSKICPDCGAEVPASHLFCGRCGARLPQDTDRAEAVPEPAGGDAEMDESEPPVLADLVLINPDGSTGESIPLRSGESVIGREAGPDLFRDDPYLSPRHAAFYLTEEQIEVRDLGSLNGIFFRISEPTELRHGDTIRIGRQVLRFQVLDQCEPVIEPAADGTQVLGAPRGEAWGRVVRVSAPERSSQAFLLTEPEAVIGRERGSILIRDDGFVSGRHSRIAVSGGRYFIEDLRSSNGTFIKVRSRRTIENGDLLLIGQQPLRVTIFD